MEYPYWLMLVGCALIGSIGLAIQREAPGASPTEKTSSEDRSEPEGNLTPVEAYKRAAKEKRKARWTESPSDIAEPEGNRAPAIATSPVAAQTDYCQPRSRDTQGLRK
jgi:hypothetical protein